MRILYSTAIAQYSVSPSQSVVLSKFHSGYNIKTAQGVEKGLDRHAACEGEMEHMWAIKPISQLSRPASHVPTTKGSDLPASGLSISTAKRQCSDLSDVFDRTLTKFGQTNGTAGAPSPQHHTNIIKTAIEINALRMAVYTFDKTKGTNHALRRRNCYWLPYELGSG